MRMLKTSIGKREPLKNQILFQESRMITAEEF
jgi:hypothetical protein